MSTLLSKTRLAALTRYMCRKLGLPLPEKQRFDALFTDPIPQPVIIRSRSACLWVDRYYMAYDTGGEVVYVYDAEEEFGV